MQPVKHNLEVRVKTFMKLQSRYYASTNVYLEEENKTLFTFYF